MKNHWELPKPTSQTQEALYLLLKRGFMSRKDFMNEAHILNSPECIRRLRERGLAIETIEINSVNKFGRDICYGSYGLKNPSSATEKYLKMLKNDKDE